MSRATGTKGYLSQVAGTAAADGPMLTVRPGFGPGFRFGDAQGQTLAPVIEDHFECAGGERTPAPEGFFDSRGDGREWGRELPEAGSADGLSQDGRRRAGRRSAASPTGVTEPGLLPLMDWATSPAISTSFLTQTETNARTEAGWAGQRSSGQGSQKRQAELALDASDGLQTEASTVVPAQDAPTPGRQRSRLSEFKLESKRAGNDPDQDLADSQDFSTASADASTAANSKLDASNAGSRNRSFRANVGRVAEEAGELTGADLNADGQAKREAKRHISFDDAAQRRSALELPAIEAAQKPGTGARHNSSEPQNNSQQGRGEPGKSSARVHIGTVEIRAVLPQPSRTAAVTPTPQDQNRTAPGRGSGAAEPLARGLAWSYGLVQG